MSFVAAAAIGHMGAVRAADPATPVVTVTATRLPQTESPVSQSVVVLSEREVRDRAAASFPELLRDVASLHVDQPGTGFSSLYLRGADPNHTVILIDGVKVSDPTNTRGGGIDLSLIDPRTIASVEILPGASSAIHGADAMAGVVNIITRRPVRTGWRVGAGIGGSGYRTGFVEGSARSSAVALQAQAAATNDGHTSDFARTRLRTGSLRLEAGDPQERHVTAWVRMQQREGAGFPEDSGGPMFAVRRELEQRDTHGVVAALNGEARTTWGSLRAYSNLYTQDGEVSSPGVAPGVRDPFGLPRTASAAHYRRWAFGTVAVIGSGADAPALIGAQYEKEEGEDRSTLFFGPFSMPADFNLERHTRSVFGEGRLRLGQHVSAHAGLRADDTEVHGTHITYQAGMRYRPTYRGPSIALNYGTGFKPPSFFALGHPLVGNRALVPEESRTLEASIASEPAPGALQRLSYRAAVFQSRYDNLVDFDAGPPPQLVNRSEVEIKGYDAAAAARISDKLQLRAGATGLAFALPAGTAALRNRPRFRATAAGSYKVTPELTASLHGSWVGRVFDSSIPTGGVYLSPYLLLDASLAYTRRGVRFAVAIDNLLDRNYQQFVGFPGRGRRARIQVSIDI